MKVWGRLRRGNWGSLSVALLAVACSSDPEQAQQPRPQPFPRELSLYVPVRDGTRIAVDVHLPRGIQQGTVVPTILRVTRYWRAIELLDGGLLEDPYGEAIARHGYAYVTMDVRGSGASFGVSTAPWSPEEVLDYRDVLDWLVEQPWSNGRVGALGDSYEANTAAMLSALDHPAVRAVVPRFFDLDVYRSPALPGGLFDELFLRNWSDLTKALDEGDLCGVTRAASDAECQETLREIRGPRRVQEDADRSLLAQAMAEHAGNTEVYPAVSAITYRDDPFGAGGPTLSEVTPFAHTAAIDRGNVPWLSWGSWFDSGTADAALSAFATFSNPQSVIIGPWSHGALFDANPYRAADAPLELSEEDQLEQALTFLDTYVRGDAAPAERSIRYYTVVEGEWRTTATWPPPGIETLSWYLAAEAQLASAPPSVAGSDRYDVDFTATTGAANRWATQRDGSDVIYADRASEAPKLLTYTSEPLSEALRVVGHPVIRLYLSTTREDGALFVYLEDVAPDGSVTYVTEGELRLLHRRTSAAPYVAFGPQHSFLRADSAPLVPGTTELVELTLLPVSVLIGNGHRLRVSVAGHDADTFRRYPEEGDVELTVEWSPERASSLALPILR
jgi:uncharacterized protein